MGVYVMVSGYADQHLNMQSKYRRIPVPIQLAYLKYECGLFWRRLVFGTVATLYGVTEYQETELCQLREDELMKLCAQAGEPI